MSDCDEDVKTSSFIKKSSEPIITNSTADRIREMNA